MPLFRIDIERALDEIASQEEGMRFQGLAVVLGKKRWPELIARQRKKDFGLDAYAPASLTPERIGKGLAASITPTLKKISDDAETAKRNFPDLRVLLFVTSAKVGNADRQRWEETIQKDHSVELHILEREEIITLMMLPENVSLCASFLHLDIDAEPQVADLIRRTRIAAAAVARTWAARTKGHPLIDLSAVRIDPNGAESSEVWSLAEIDQSLSQSRRIVLEGPAGRGKTTTLVQLTQRARASGTTFIVELPAWTSSRRAILDYVAGMPAFQAEGLTNYDLARVQQTEPFWFLLNGWNEIAESNSAQANDALRELERDFPSAGIIIATRTHHLTPPLPGALRLRLLPIRRAQRAAYLESRLGAKSAELRSRIDSDSSLDELTSTPFILSEVASLFEAGAPIPSTKIGILAQVLRLQELREEHRNSLQAEPIFDLQTDYLKALATEMTHRGAVELPEVDARATVAAVSRELVGRGQIQPVWPPVVLASLTAHHVLVRVDYLKTSFQFEHQQLQEYYATLDVRVQLLNLSNDDREALGRFTANYVNDPAWAEPLRMIAQTLAEQTGAEADGDNCTAGVRLVTMALSVDPIFAGELAQLCGAVVWNEVRATMRARLGGLYSFRAGAFRQIAIAAMLATGADDFADLIVPLLSGNDQQTRLGTYRLWPDIQVSTLGANWRDQVRGWSDEARVDFVSELLHHRNDGEIAAFAAEDRSVEVKKAAAFGLMWTESDDTLTSVLAAMDEQAFDDVLRQNADFLPAVLRPRTLAAMRKFVEGSTDQPARLRSALDLIRSGEPGMDGVIKSALAAITSVEVRDLGGHYIQSALEHLRKSDPVWASEWVATQIAEGFRYGNEHWLPFLTATPSGVVEKWLERLETEDLRKVRSSGIVSVVAAHADATLAARVFQKLRDLRGATDAEPGQQLELDRQILSQLEDVYRNLPHDIAVAGILSSVTSGVPLDIKVAAGILSKVARSDMELLRIADVDMKARLRAYLIDSVETVLLQDDFSGEEKANLALSIAQVGKPEDMADLVRLVRSDIERVRRGRAARAASDRAALGNGSTISYARWHTAALMLLDSIGAEQVLIDLLPEPEYRSEVAAAMARDFVPKTEHSIGRPFRYDLIWVAREVQNPAPGGDQRRARFAAALGSEIKRLRKQVQYGDPSAGLKELAKALAAIDGRGSVQIVLDEIATPGQWDHYTCLDAAERLLMAGVVLPVNAVFVLVDSIVERMGKWTHDSDRGLLRRTLALCPFLDDPGVGIAKMRDTLGKGGLRPHELTELVIALGESRADSAVDLLFQLASDASTFEQCEDKFINALAVLDTPRARELLLGFVDPNIRGIVLTRRLYREDILVKRLGELAERRPEVAARLLSLCECDLADLNRHILSKVLDWLGTPEAFVANLNLIDDAMPSPVPEGVRDQLERAFIERRPYGQSSNVFTRHARASNDLRVLLFRMASGDEKRRESALMLLGQIEEWRLEHGRPMGESRHPDLASGLSWPPQES